MLFGSAHIGRGSAAAVDRLTAKDRRQSFRDWSPVAPNFHHHTGAKFGAVSGRSAGLKKAMRKPLIGIEISPGISDASREVRNEVRNRRVGILGKKKGLTNLQLVGLWNLTLL